MLRFRNGDFLDGLLGLGLGKLDAGQKVRHDLADGRGAFVLLQLGEDFPGPLDDGLWDARQTRNFDAVAPVGRSGDQAAEEDDFPVPFPMFMVCTPGILPSSAVSSW